MRRVLFILACVIVSFEGCRNSHMDSSADLVVVEQIDSVFGNNEENNYCWASFNVDVPVNGPQVLVDSVMVLVNSEVYKMCEFCVKFVLSPDEYVALLASPFFLMLIKNF